MRKASGRDDSTASYLTTIRRRPFRPPRLTTSAAGQPTSGGHGRQALSRPVPHPEAPAIPEAHNLMAQTPARSFGGGFDRRTNSSV
jgi:hypothetical protein